MDGAFADNSISPGAYFVVLPTEMMATQAKWAFQV